MLYLPAGAADIKRLRRAVTALAALCLFLAMPCAAQDDDAQGSDLPAGSEASGDPAGSDRILGRLGIRPIYTTDMAVNRRAVNWNQNLKVDRTLQRLKLTNTWDVKLAKNPDQNHYRRHDAGMTALGEYSFPGLGGWSTGGDLGLYRNFTGGDFNRTVQNANRFNWFATAGGPGGLVTHLLRLPEGALSWDFTGSVGATDNVDVRENQSQGGVGVRSDSTHATGNTDRLGTRIAAELGQKWRLDVTGQVDRDRDHSKTRQFETSGKGIVDTTLAAQNSSRMRRASVTAAWTPNPQNRFNFTGMFVRSVGQAYSADVRAQDTKTGIDRRLNLDAKLVPFWGVNLEMKVADSRTDFSYALSPQGRGNTRRTANGRLNFVIGGAVPLLRGTEVTADGNWEKSRNTFQTSTTPANTTDYGNEATVLRGNLRRPLGTRVVAVATGEASIGRVKYDSRKSDRDDLRYLLDGSLGYRPRTGFECRLIAQWRESQSVYIPAANSRNSVTAKSYAIGADAGLQLTPLVKVSQNYRMSADYSFYDFNEGSNILSRTTEVRTNLLSTLGSKAKLNLDHSFRFKDSGRYVRESPGAERLYAKASGETIQTLALATRYDFNAELALYASERIEVRELRPRGNPAPPPVNSRKLEFTGGMDLNHRFSRDFTVNARVAKTQSSAEKGYWRVTGALSQVF